jgi:DNA-binding NtrC family response regulator
MSHEQRPPDGGEGQAHAAGLVRELLQQTPSLRGLIDPLTLAAAQDLTLLFTGETGTGKTHLARLIHEHSRRRDHRLLVIPCGALSPRLTESELFGHVRGAFTGADRDQPGKLGSAGQGTILLDEVDALGLEQQAKLLRVLETGEYEPVGSTQTRQCLARVIAASNIDLGGAVARGGFREDLYYRLTVLTVHLPPLRERPEDIGPLARGMVAEFGPRFGKGKVTLSAGALAALEAFPWPGNIRQLQNVVQRAVLNCAGPELLRQHLPLPGATGAAPPREDRAAGGPGGPAGRTLSLRR